MKRSRLSAIARQRCPRCREGRVFRGILNMRERCEVCGLVFEREHGYFTGAIVVGYAIAVPLLALLTAGVWLIGRWPLEWTLVVADLVFLIAVPAIFQYSRVIWMHLDRGLDPEPKP